MIGVLNDQAVSGFFYRDRGFNQSIGWGFFYPDYVIRTM